MDNKKTRAYIENLLKLEQKYRSELLLILVANVEGETVLCDDYNNTSVLSEYYTLDEYETLSSSYKKMGYEVLSYFNETDFISAVLQKQFDAKQKKILVINSAQTGTYIGRKSLIPAFCEHLKIMHTGSNPYVVSLCRDKFHSNAILRSYTSNYTATYLYTENGWLGNRHPQQDIKLIAKLNGESASIGLNEDNVFTYSTNTDKYLKGLLKQYKQPIIVQPFISGYEIELPIICESDKLPLIAAGIKIGDDKMLGDKFLDYKSRFFHLYSFYNFNESFSEFSQLVEAEAITVARILGIEGFGRVDFRITPSGEIYVSDISTNPHITKDSSYSFVFQELGYSYSEMLATQIGLTLLKHSFS